MEVRWTATRALACSMLVAFACKGDEGKQRPGVIGDRTDARGDTLVRDAAAGGMDAYVAIDECSSQDELTLDSCAPGSEMFSPSVDHPYFPLHAGMRSVLTGEVQGQTVRLERAVLPQTEMVSGVSTHVLEEAELRNAEVVRISRDYFAQTMDGTVCHFGSYVERFAHGELSGFEGSWRADQSDHRPGIAMPVNPVIGDAFAYSFAPTIAEEFSRVLSISETVRTPAGDFDRVVRLRQCTRLADEVVHTLDYASGIGLIAIDQALLESHAHGL